MMHTTRLSTLASLLAAVLLAGCAQTPVAGGGAAPSPAPHTGANMAGPRPGAEPQPSPAAADPAQTALHDGIEAFGNGDYNGAIRKLGAPEIGKSSRATQLSAIKYTAFSYCVSGRPKQCRQQFDKALKLDPNFELETGEDGHPLWGPVFARAKKARPKGVAPVAATSKSPGAAH
jgi:predicted small secreted protein